MMMNDGLLLLVNFNKVALLRTKVRSEGAKIGAGVKNACLTLPLYPQVQILRRFANSSAGYLSYILPHPAFSYKAGAIAHRNILQVAAFVLQNRQNHELATTFFSIFYDL